MLARSTPPVFSPTARRCNSECRPDRRIWGRATGQSCASSRAHRPGHSAAYSPDGKDHRHRQFGTRPPHLGRGYRPGARRLLGHTDSVPPLRPTARMARPSSRQWRPDRSGIWTRYRKRDAAPAGASTGGVTSAAYSPDGQTNRHRQCGRHCPHLGLAATGQELRRLQGPPPAGVTICGLQPGWPDHRQPQLRPRPPHLGRG